LAVANGLATINVVNKVMSLSSGFSKKRVQNLAGVIEAWELLFFGRSAAISVGIWPAVDAVASSRAVISSALWKGSADHPKVVYRETTPP
jgi:hypothetical protein